ncbi:MAG TPA: hypothetical protein VEG38_22885 [Acidimicrobiia bacterium]|nr:hypothetical protein [Acidimicrobiia bacterium]
MHCPFCSFEGPPRQLHAHLGDQHADAVRFEDRGGRSFYTLACPICGDGYEREIKPRGRDPGFVDQFSAQIRLVALDMLVNHLLGEHEEVALPADDEEAEGDAAPAALADAPVPAWLAEARRAKQENGN